MSLFNSTRFASLLTACALLVLITASNSAFSQRIPFNPPGLAGSNIDPDGSEFSFARLIYGEGGQRGFGRGFGGRGRCGGGSWTTDCPEAEHFFMEGISRLTRVDGTKVNIYNGEGAAWINLQDGTIFDFPWLYAVEVGNWSLVREEAAILREYLLRGGFLMVDDFHGSNQWNGFVVTMKQVFPDRAILDIPESDEVMHVLYDLDQSIQIHGISRVGSGVTYEQDGYKPTWRGIYDDDGRLIVAINHNMDLGDAWEHADDPRYPEPLTALSYRYAVNYVIYAMTH